MDYQPKHDWPNLPRYNLTVRIPKGYMKHPDDVTIFIPDVEQIRWIEEALDHIDAGNSLRNVAEWLSDKLPRPISHQGISDIWKKYRGKDKTTARAKAYRKRKRATVPKTKDEKELQKIKHKVIGAKQALKSRTEKFEQLSNKINPPIPEQSIPIEATASNSEVVFRPNSGPQEDFLAAWEQEVLYGGAAGGGKSYAMLADPMRYFGNPNFTGVLFRKTNDELRELIMKSHGLYDKAYPGAKWQEQKSRWVFPSGAQMWLTYLDRDTDVERYQGQAFTWIGFDELGHWDTPYAWNYMRSRLRSTDPTIPLSMRASANPGGLGGAWLKKMFINPAPPNSTFNATDIETGEVMVFPKGHVREGQPLFQRRFIPAKLSDNPYLTQDDHYEASLLSLPEHIKQQLLYGNWDIMDGAAFTEFDQNIHVIEPFEIPSSWKRFRSCDYGYTSFAAVHWFAIDPIYETLIVYRELYVTKHTGLDLADKILALEKDEKIMYGMLDSSVWQERGQRGPSVAEEMIMRGVRWRPSDRGKGSRTAGKNRLHELLKVKDMGVDINNEIIWRPGIQFFNNCRQIIADLPTLPVDPDGADDIDQKHASDHTYDSIRYGIMSRPRGYSPFEFGGPSFDTGYRPADRAFGY